MTQNRPPIVVILGHVDHGKTSLLDYLRHTNIVAGEAGGITQHTRSFQLTAGNSRPITFIDTPGHAAFKDMRARGSRLADIAVLVVAADDGVKPQTRESIDFINSAGLPFVVALNKSDLPTSDPDRVKTELSQAGVVVEDFGGGVPAVPISAKTGSGIPDLLEIIQLLDQLHPAQADPDGPLEMLVLESRLDPKKGPVATVIVKNGTLATGQPVFQSVQIGKVRSLTDPDGRSVDTAFPSQPVEILGLSAVPVVGSSMSDRPVPQTAPAPVVKGSAPAESKINLILKADVAGSLEAILASLDPQVRVLSAATGDISENDILLARSTPALVYGFNVRLSGSVAKLAETEKVSVRTYKIIYELLDDLNNQLRPESLETILGEAVVQAQFKINSERIAGCRAVSGVLSRGDQLRLVREGQVLGTTKFKSLNLGKNPADKVKAGLEFGAVFSPAIDFRPGDNIIAFAETSNP